ncbi:hypothetical protein D092_21495 [Rhodococcus ruber Chol-4]|uniref:DUF2892 domain-containing protein n=2 Tax=Rhodococcus TaxID=1827 RepID=A0A0M9WP89_RHORH|nr:MULTISPECIES: DUF2892 domain-containing protein [Rhodococcus]MDO2380677.1 DUF2892 domain-containing protein [Rhodococcus ruber]RIK10109.1 MAG: DUF2892 domain-containing protein [Acidobacteriota bacterium]ATQ29566.1 DUF2892 domain-containing protein [Rhodococcus ruber]AUM18587.1 DUF2892 domain-containing protein [Rhodococcus ruber]AWH00967.1 DUF2892 domain-containing protein [Rhodococcus ruber]
MVDAPGVNITGVERVGRMFLGGATGWTVVPAVLPPAAGVDLPVTAAIGHWPLYHEFSCVPTSSRTESR